jgi:hypothetical protein
LPIFESIARVCRSENTVFGSKVAFNFVDRFIEFDKLLTRNTQAQIAARSPLFVSETSQLVPTEYRAFCADVLKLLRAYRAVLETKIERLQAWRANRVDYTAIHGEGTWAAQELFYATIDRLYRNGSLGGVRLTARRS